MSRPIGVFDSGVGGLTVLKALRRRLPDHDFIYFSDTARVPYGRKPKEMVCRFAREITAFSSSSTYRHCESPATPHPPVALPDLCRGGLHSVWGVIDPGVEAARRVTRSGARRCHRNQRHHCQRRLPGDRSTAAGLDVWAQACPMFVHLVEEGLADSDDARVLARHYLGPMPPVDTLILGCTHYPVSRRCCRRSRVRLLRSSPAPRSPRRSSLNSTAEMGPQRAGRVTHYVTGGVHAYQHTAEAIGGVEGKLIPLDVTRLSDAGSVSAKIPLRGIENSAKSAIRKTLNLCLNEAHAAVSVTCPGSVYRRLQGNLCAGGRHESLRPVDGSSLRLSPFLSPLRSFPRSPEQQRFFAVTRRSSSLTSCTWR